MERHQKAISEFAQLLESAIHAKGWTHEAAGDALGATQQTVSRWVAGTILPKYERLPYMAEILQLDRQALEEAWNRASIAKYGRPSRLAQLEVDRALRSDAESTKASYEDLEARLKDLEAKFAEILGRFPDNP